MTDRLRRLDALFAEKVFGYATERFRVTHPGTSADGWALTGKQRGGDILLPYPRPLPQYTRSLDAAWEGAQRLRLVTLYQYGDVSVEISDDRLDGPSACIHCPGLGQSFRGDSQAHPAEALVLACLRAVGCTEKEIE